MEYRYVESLDAALPRLVYGTGNRAVQGADYPAAADCLAAAWEAGFRAFDTANCYGCAEENLGRWLDESGNRSRAFLLTKGHNCGMRGSSDVYGAETIRRQLALSLRRLRTERVELYILHRDDPSRDVGEIVEALNEARTAGSIGAFGASNWTLRRVDEANRYAAAHGLEGFSALSPAYSLAEMVGDPYGGSVTLSGERGGALRAYLEKTRLPVFAYSPLARGFLSGKYRADALRSGAQSLPADTAAEYVCQKNLARLARAEQLAAVRGTTVSCVCLAWLLSQEMALFPIVGPAGERHMLENAAAPGLHLSPQERRWLLSGEENGV